MKRVGEIEPSRPEPPITLEVDFNDRQVAWYVSWMPAIAYDGDRTVSVTFPNGYDFDNGSYTLTVQDVTSGPSGPLSTIRVHGFSGSPPTS